MKHNWEYKRLGDVCFAKKDIGRANSIYSTNDEISYFDISSIDNQTKQATSYTTIPFGNAPSRAQQVIENGDILYSLVRPNLKNIALLNSNATNKVGTSGFCILRGKDVLPQYILYFVLSIHFTDYILTRATGASYPAVTEKDVRRASIPVPPIDVQKHIVAELDKLYEVIATKREQIKQLDLLAQSIFYDTFGDPVTNPKGWIVSKLHYECLEITDGDHAAPPKSNEGIPFITISNIDKERYIIDFTDSYYVPRTYFESIKNNRKPQKGDVLYTVTGSYGITVEVKDNLEFCFQRHIGLLRPGNNLNSTFLAYWGRSEGMKFVADKVATGIAQKTVSLSSLRDFPLILPPLSLQQQFAMRVEAIEKQKAQIEESIKELQILLDSRMDYWFN